jgi:hypothetical protein
MSEQIKDVNAKIDEAEAAMKKYASKDTVISIGGYEFTPAKLMVAFTLVSSTLGGLYGAFEVYKDYQGMKKKIASYEAPDLSGFDKRLAVIEENSEENKADVTDEVQKSLPEKSEVHIVNITTQNLDDTVYLFNKAFGDQSGNAEFQKFKSDYEFQKEATTGKYGGYWYNPATGEIDRVKVSVHDMTDETLVLLERYFREQFRTLQSENANGGHHAWIQRQVGHRRSGRWRGSRPQ